MILLIFFIALLFVSLRRISVATFFILILILSLSCTFLTGFDYPIDSLFMGFNVAITGIILTLIIAPWMKMRNIHEIYFPNQLQLKKITTFLLIVSCFSFITLGITNIYVFSTFGYDINYLKYSEGVFINFLYTSLPIPFRVWLLAKYLVNYSFFLVPLHFYYLGKREFRLSILCFVFSLSTVIHGLTYYSRAAIVHYILFYLSFLIILHRTIDKQSRRYLKVVFAIIAIISFLYFALITNERFSDYSTTYRYSIPYKSVIQDPVKYSCVDYFSQWYKNSMFVLNSYNYRTFKGQISLQPVLSLLGRYGIINYDVINYTILRKSLWPYHWCSFNGFVAYSIYDYGYILAFIFSLGYFYVVKRLGPVENRISLMNLFYLILLIQLPATAAFYSAVGGILIPFMLLIPIHLYIKMAKPMR